MGFDLVSGSSHCPIFVAASRWPWPSDDNSHKFPTSLNAALRCLGPENPSPKRNWASLNGPRTLAGALQRQRQRPESGVSGKGKSRPGEPRCVITRSKMLRLLLAHTTCRSFSHNHCACRAEEKLVRIFPLCPVESCQTAGVFHSTFRDSEISRNIYTYFLLVQSFYD